MFPYNFKISLSSSTQIVAGILTRVDQFKENGILTILSV